MQNMSDNIRGAIFMTGCMTCFTVNDGFMKSLADELPLFQAIFLRGIFTSILLAILAWKLGGLQFSMPKTDRILVSIRSLAELAAAYFFLTALFNMPIANVSAILQVLPLTVALTGALFLRESIGWRRLLAILVGFVGVLLIVQPGSDGFNTYSVYAIISVICVTIRDLAARRLSGQASSMTVALVAAVAVTVGAGVASVTDEWVWPGLLAWAQLSGAVVFVIGGYIFSVMTMRVGDIGTVAPFRYVSLLIAIIIGLLFFNEWPDAITLLGAAIVVATGIFTIYRERKSGMVPAPLPLRPR